MGWCHLYHAQVRSHCCSLWIHTLTHISRCFQVRAWYIPLSPQPMEPFVGGGRDAENDISHVVYFRSIHASSNIFIKVARFPPAEVSASVAHTIARDPGWGKRPDGTTPIRSANRDTIHKQAEEWTTIPKPNPVNIYCPHHPSY